MPSTTAKRKEALKLANNLRYKVRINQSAKKSEITGEENSQKLKRKHKKRKKNRILKRRIIINRPIDAYRSDDNEKDDKSNDNNKTPLRRPKRKCREKPVCYFEGYNEKYGEKYYLDGARYPGSGPDDKFITSDEDFSDGDAPYTDADAELDMEGAYDSYHSETDSTESYTE